jgi:hypothetical protein
MFMMPIMGLDAVSIQLRKKPADELTSCNEDLKISATFVLNLFNNKTR